MGVAEISDRFFSIFVQVHSILKTYRLPPSQVSSGSLPITAGSLIYWGSWTTPSGHTIGGMRNSHEGRTHMAFFFLAKNGLFPDKFVSSEGSSFGMNATGNKKDNVLFIQQRQSQKRPIIHGQLFSIWGRHCISLATMRCQAAYTTLNHAIMWITPAMGMLAHLQERLALRRPTRAILGMRWTVWKWEHASLTKRGPDLLRHAQVKDGLTFSSLIVTGAHPPPLSDAFHPDGWKFPPSVWRAKNFTLFNDVCLACMPSFSVPPPPPPPHFHQNVPALSEVFNISVIIMVSRQGPLIWAFGHF